MMVSAAFALEGWPPPQLRWEGATASPSATPATTSTPSEAQTPLHLSDPTSPDGGLATGAPWWQSELDVTWKLVLVIGLILLAMRLLVVLKQHGFAPKIRRGNKEKTEQRHFFEQIEEIVLAPQHVLTRCGRATTSS